MSKKKKTSEEESLEWAQKAYNQLKENKNIKFRSKLEESVANLFGKTKGFKASEPPIENEASEEEDF